MDYSLSVWSIATYIESRIKEDINYEDLEQITGFTYRHIRTITKTATGLSLSNYILNRRIANAAFDLVHSTKSITDIAFDFNFNSYDAFARAFKRITGKSPKQFRSGKYNVGHRRLLMGFYAPEIYKDPDISYSHPIIQEGLKMENGMENRLEKRIEKQNDGCILYGVPKVEYSYEECTPLPTSIKAALNYMGDQVNYAYLMAASGAAFRLRWNIDSWDGGNVDVLNIYEQQYDVLRHAFDACHRNYAFITRSSSNKDDFKNFIKSEIDAGRPVIALGIIGPPEAGVIAGYADNGDTLLGWNCFQENKEMASGVTFHDSGYYVTSSWWENPYTTALISIGDKRGDKIGNNVSDKSDVHKSILKNAIDILSKDQITVYDETGKARATYAGGQAAYDLWAKQILDASQFSPDSIMPLKIEKLMCQVDAQTMVSEGRNYAACFLDSLRKNMEDTSINNKTTLQTKCTQAASLLRKSAQCSMKMFELRGGFEQSAEILENFMKQDIRKLTADEIIKAKKHEKAALDLMIEILEMLG